MDTAAQAIIKFAFEQQYPSRALRSLMRAGKIAEVYYALADDELDEALRGFMYEGIDKIWQADLVR